MLSSRKTGELAKVAEKVKGINSEARIEVLECDITKAESVEALAKRVAGDFGRLDVLVSNSGYAGPITLKVTEGDPAVSLSNDDE